MSEPPEPLLAIARILAPQGVRGEVKASLLTEFPHRFRETTEVWVGEPPTLFRVERARLSENQVVLKLSGIEDRAQAERLRGHLVQVPRSQAVSLPPGRYYWHQVIGLEVRDQAGQPLGTVQDILETGSNDVYVVRGPRGEWLLPAIREVIEQIDLDRGVLVVELLPGMGPQTER
ncbi:MAG: 16S rRNA processing protein RimM [Chloroflexi bacterium]|nr:16S rRNA processing protein RimM [Chloroflexota bacterium]